jgi:hypothetical protein
LTAEDRPVESHSIAEAAYRWLEVIRKITSSAIATLAFATGMRCEQAQEQIANCPRLSKLVSNGGQGLPIIEWKTSILLG